MIQDKSLDGSLKPGSLVSKLNDEYDDDNNVQFYTLILIRPSLEGTYYGMALFDYFLPMFL